MIYKIYALFDKDAESTNERTFTAPNDKVALRIMKTSLENDPILKKNASAYSLKCLGTYDTESGINGEPMKQVAEIVDLLSTVEHPTDAPSAE